MVVPPSYSWFCTPRLDLPKKYSVGIDAHTFVLEILNHLSVTESDDFVAMTTGMESYFQKECLVAYGCLFSLALAS